MHLLTLSKAKRMKKAVRYDLFNLTGVQIDSILCCVALKSFVMSGSCIAYLYNKMMNCEITSFSADAFIHSSKYTHSIS